jgi:hypothetical protein
MPQQRVVWVTVWSCSRCGAEIGRGGQPNAAVCPRCGASFQAFSPVAKQSAETEGSASSRIAIVALVLGGVGVVTFVVVLVVLHNRRRPTKVPGGSRSAGPADHGFVDDAPQPATDGAAQPSQFELMQGAARFTADAPREHGESNQNVRPG